MRQPNRPLAFVRSHDSPTPSSRPFLGLALSTTNNASVQAASGVGGGKVVPLQRKLFPGDGESNEKESVKEGGEDSNVWAKWLFRRPTTKVEGSQGGQPGETEGGSTVNGGSAQQEGGNGVDVQPVEALTLNLAPLTVGSSLDGDGQKLSEYGGAHYGVRVHAPAKQGSGVDSSNDSGVVW